MSSTVCRGPAVRSFGKCESTLRVLSCQAAIKQQCGCNDLRACVWAFERAEGVFLIMWECIFECLFDRKVISFPRLLLFFPVFHPFKLEESRIASTICLLTFRCHFRPLIPVHTESVNSDTSHWISSLFTMAYTICQYWRSHCTIEVGLCYDFFGGPWAEVTAGAWVQLSTPQNVWKHDLLIHIRLLGL